MSFVGGIWRNSDSTLSHSEKSASSRDAALSPSYTPRMMNCIMMPLSFVPFLLVELFAIGDLVSVGAENSRRRGSRLNRHNSRLGICSRSHHPPHDCFDRRQARVICFTDHGEKLEPEIVFTALHELANGACDKFGGRHRFNRRALFNPPQQGRI